MRIDLVIFDCDGVIADSEVLSAQVLIEELAEIGIAITAEDVRRDFLGRSFPSVAQTIRDRFSRPLPPDFEAEYRRRLLLRFQEDLSATPGFTAMLQGLDRRFCVATSSSPPRLDRTLQILGLSDFFTDNRFTASQVSRGKPAPDLFLLAASRMGVPPARALVVEDSPPGIQAAQSAGMQVLAYRGGAHLAGQPLPEPSAIPCFDNWGAFPHLLQGIEARGSHE